MDIVLLLKSIDGEAMPSHFLGGRSSNLRARFSGRSSSEAIAARPDATRCLYLSKNSNKGERILTREDVTPGHLLRDTTHGDEKIAFTTRNESTSL